MIRLVSQMNCLYNYSTLVIYRRGPSRRLYYDGSFQMRHLSFCVIVLLRAVESRRTRWPLRTTRWSSVRPDPEMAVWNEDGGYRVRAEWAGRPTREGRLLLYSFEGSALYVCVGCWMLYQARDYKSFHLFWLFFHSDDVTGYMTWSRWTRRRTDV